MLVNQLLPGCTLEERLWALRRKPAAQPADTQRAASRLARWRGVPPFNDPETLARCLGALQLDLDGLQSLIATPPDATLGDEPPDWCRTVAEAYARHDATPLPLRSGFLRGLSPLLAPPLERLRARFGEAADRFLLPDVAEQLTLQAYRMLVLEVNVARLRGELQGETPAERFAWFDRSLEQPGVLLPLLAEYPVLTRQLLRSIEQWERNSAEILERLESDRADIVGRLCDGRDPGALAAISASAGDLHAGGRSVRVLTFENGTRVVYKPRSLEVDVRFGELLEWLNARGAEPAFEAARVLDRATHGWAEFIAPAPCADDAALRRFYRRQGGLLAILYALDATDIHRENLIARGEHPCLIDLEALFHHRPEMPDADVGALATQAMGESVMRVGLLPRRIWSADAEDEGLDMSGLGGSGGQTTPFEILGFEQQATDEVRAVRKRLTIDAKQNQPALGDAAVDLTAYIGEILDGFDATYRLLMRESHALLAEEGPVERLAQAPVRAILRSTQVYASLLMESFHPDVLRDALDRRHLFDRLWIATRHTPAIAAAVPAEIRDLERGDVPFFRARPASRDLWTSDGERIPDFFRMPSLDFVRQRIAGLSESDLAWQSWFISASIASLSSPPVGRLAVGRLGGGAEGRADGHDADPSQPPNRPTANRPTGGEAAAIAARLRGLAIRGEDDANWIGLTFVGDRHWTLLPLAADLYNGTLGIALFLAYAGDDDSAAIARLTLDATHRRVPKAIEGVLNGTVKSGPGGFSGPGALLYTFTHAGVLWNDSAYLEAAHQLVPAVARLVQTDETLDVIGGSAGAILNLLALWRATGSASALDTARAAGERLLARAVTMPYGIAWPTPVAKHRPLLGFSHGAAGIAYALLELSAATGDDVYLPFVRGAFEYERGLFSAERANWPDFRAAEPSFMVAWCHGAPGIAASRLAAKKAGLDDPRLDEELDVAVRTTLTEGLTISHSLCHGALGNLEVVDEIARHRGDDELRGQVRRLVDGVLAEARERGWSCGTPKGIETPGLMAGLAGIGYVLLRLADPDRVPALSRLAGVTR